METLPPVGKPKTSESNHNSNQTAAMSTSADNDASNTQERSPSTAVQDNQKKIVVRTEDGEIFELKDEVAKEIAIIKNYFFQEDDVSYETVLPLHYVESWELVKIIEYCSKYIDLKDKVDGDKELKAFQDEFVKDLSPESLLSLTNAANFLEVKYLLDFLSQGVAEKIKNKSVEYVRKLFGVENDFCDEEYEQVMAEAPWAHENIDNDNESEVIGG